MLIAIAWPVGNAALSGGVDVVPFLTHPAVTSPGTREFTIGEEGRLHSRASVRGTATWCDRLAADGFDEVAAGHSWIADDGTPHNKRLLGGAWSRVNYHLTSAFNKLGGDNRASTRSPVKGESPRFIRQSSRLALWPSR